MIESLYILNEVEFDDEEIKKFEEEENCTVIKCNFRKMDGDKFAYTVLVKWN